MEILMSAVLIPCSVWDIKEKKMPLWFLFLGFIGSMGVYFFFPHSKVMHLLFSFLPGTFFLLYGKVTESMGCGDGLIILMGGFWMNGEKIWLWLFVAFFMAAIFSVFLLWMKKKNKYTRIPFVPFLMLSLILCNAFIF